MTSSNLNSLFCNNVFHWKGPIGPNMSSKIYNILRRYHICIKSDIFEPKLAYFDKYLSMKRMNETKYVLGIYNAKCFKLLMSSVFVVLLANDINVLELSFL